MFAPDPAASALSQRLSPRAASAIQIGISAPHNALAPARPSSGCQTRTDAVRQLEDVVSRGASPPRARSMAAELSDPRIAFAMEPYDMEFDVSPKGVTPRIPGVPHVSHHECGIDGRRAEHRA